MIRRRKTPFNLAAGGTIAGMRPLALTLVCLLGPIAGPACAHSGGFGGDDRDAITELLHAQQDAWNRGDLEGFLRGYEPSPELLFTSGGKVRRGYAATRARYESRYLGMHGTNSTTRTSGTDNTNGTNSTNGTSHDDASTTAEPPGTSKITSKMGKLELEVQDIRGLGSDGAMVLGRWRLTSTPEAGEGVFSLALLRTRAGWRIVHDHTSLATP